MFYSETRSPRPHRGRNVLQNAEDNFGPRPRGPVHTCFVVKHVFLASLGTGLCYKTRVIIFGPRPRGSVYTCCIVKHVSLGRIGVGVCYKMRMIILGPAPGALFIVYTCFILENVFLGCLGAGICYKTQVIILGPASGALFIYTCTCPWAASESEFAIQCGV